MRQFAKLYTDFWVNYDNSEVIKLGADVQLMALYLRANTHQNMLGAYYLPLLYIASDIKLSVKKVERSIQKLCEISYCKYDYKTQYIWVCNLAAEQLGDDLDLKDNRIKAIHSVWQSLPKSLEFLEEIYYRYKGSFYLEKRDFQPVIKNSQNQSDDTTRIVDLSISSLNSSLNYDFSPSLLPLEGASKGEYGFIGGCGRYNFIGFNNFYGEVATVSPSNSDINHLEATDGTTFMVKVGVAETEVGDVGGYPRSFVTNYLATTLGVPSKGNIENPSLSLYPSKGVSIPLKGASKPLQSPSEAPSKVLRSNIDYRIKNIDNRNKKIELKKLEKEKKREINLDYVPPSNIVAQEKAKAARPDVVDKVDSDHHPLAAPSQNQNQKQTQIPSFDFDRPSSVIAAAEVKTELKSASNSSDKNSVTAIFEYWKEVMQHPRAKIDRKRENLIRSALQLGYSVQDLCDAITGCFRTPFNRGSNDRKQRYDGLHIILRDADHIDAFIHNCYHPPSPASDADRIQQANVCAASSWIKQKLGDDPSQARRFDSS